MSRGRPTEGERRMLERSCGACEQPAGEWCRSRNGLHVAHLHAARFWGATYRGRLPLERVQTTAADVDEDQGDDQADGDLEQQLLDVDPPAPAP